MSDPQEERVMATLITQYQAIGVPTDRLPYSPEFEELYHRVLTSTGAPLGRSDCWRLLAKARKRGWLPRLCH